MVTKLKAKLRWVVQTTSSGSQQEFVEKMNKAGSNIGQSTLSGWLDDNRPYIPKMSDIWYIQQFRPDISADWLIGTGDPHSPAEQFIDEEIERSR